MSDASIYLNGKEVTKTGIDGVYNLESMRAGTYKIKVEKCKFFVAELGSWVCH